MINIPSNTIIVGEIRSSGKVRIDGRIEGLGEIDGYLTIGVNAVWKGKLTADTIYVFGVFEGDIIARRRIIVGEKATITGSVSAPAMSIAEGGKVEGKLRMLQPGQTVARLEKRRETPRLASPAVQNQSNVVSIGH